MKWTKYKSWAPWSFTRTPLVLQMESAECGAAALAILLRYHGRFDSLADLRSECGVSRDGALASDIVRVGQNRGLKMSAYRVPDLAKVPLQFPFIALWKKHHL